MLNDKDDDADPQSQWPSVGLAYDFVQPSYDWLLNRVNAAEGRIQTGLTFAASITLLVPVIAKTVFVDLDFGSLWLILAMITFIATVMLGAVSRFVGELTLVSPKKLYDEWLHYSEWEFKKNAIYFAGQHFEANRKLVRTKGTFVEIMTFLLLLEVLWFVIWVAEAA